MKDLGEHAFDFPSSSRELVVNELELLRRTAGRSARQAIESTNTVFALLRTFRDGACSREDLGLAIDATVTAVDDLARSLRALRGGLDIDPSSRVSPK
jgi:hypothetical protein